MLLPTIACQHDIADSAAVSARSVLGPKSRPITQSRFLRTDSSLASKPPSGPVIKPHFLNKLSVIIKQNVFPVLITSYTREYFIDYNKKFRSTIDTNLNVLSVLNNKIKLPINKEILELKYDLENDNNFRNNIVNSNFKLRFQKFSKYSVGLLSLKKNGLI